MEENSVVSRAKFARRSRVAVPHAEKEAFSKGPAMNAF